MDKYACIILLGGPGSGKTTALEHLAYELAAEPDRLPLPLRLSEFGPGLTVEEFIAQSWAGSEQAGHWGAAELAANLAGYLAAGQLFILFDALNEMPQEGYRERVQALRGFIDKWSAQGNRFLVTCRVLDYGEELSGLQRVEVQPLSNDQIQAFLQKELPDRWAKLWETLNEGPAIPNQTFNIQHRKLLEMARNPYLLTMMIDIFAEDGQLGQNRARLLARFTQILLGWAKAKCAPAQWLAAEVQVEALACWPLRPRPGPVWHKNKDGAGQSSDAPPSAARPGLALVPAPPDQVLALAAGANLIEMPVDHSSVRFYHQLLQEYFAARQMLKRVAPSNSPHRGEGEFTSPPVGGTEGGLIRLWRWKWLETETPLWKRPERNYDPLPPPDTTGWEETTILAAGLAAENDDQLIQALIPINPVLAGRCLHEGQAKVDKAIRQRVIDELLTTIAQPEVALRVRIAAGEVLGYLGDPRPGALVTVPAGEFLMGESQEQHKLYLPEYQIGKYPLTNAEFAAFIETGGYQEQQWWTERGWQQKEKENWTEPRYWNDSRFNTPNRPVVGVSWYECVAYCRWLSAEPGQTYRLPSEAEWEKAARGPDGRRYPWGDVFEAGRLNADEGEQVVRTTTPVGIYPTGISPSGAFDCAGNVWEWCATGWKGFSKPKPYPYDVSEDEWSEKYLNRTNVRVLRGGSWFVYADYARCARRSWSGPIDGDYFRGVRLRVSPI